MFIKEAVVKAGKKLIGEKTISRIQNQFLVQLVFLTAIKNYLYKATADQKIFIIPDQVRRKSEQRKLILVLDMDQTLVYTRRQSKPQHSNYIKTQCDDEDMYIEPRPFAKDFLIAASQIFTIYVYTAGKKKYADSVLNRIDEIGLIEKRFYRESCKKFNGSVIKDLRYLKKILKSKTDMILVDDNCESIKQNYPFSVKIQAFQGDQNDSQLHKVFQTILKFYK